MDPVSPVRVLLSQSKALADLVLGLEGIDPFFNVCCSFLEPGCERQKPLELGFVGCCSLMGVKKMMIMMMAVL